MASVTFPSSLGGDNSTVTDDANATTGLANGGHRTRFVPSLSQMVACMNGALSQASSYASTATTQATNSALSATSAAASALTAQAWATQTSSEVVSGQGYGAKKYANDAASSYNAALALGSVLPAQAGNAGLTVITDGTVTAWGTSNADAIAILNSIGYYQ